MKVDPQALLSYAVLSSADVLMAYREDPHPDSRARGGEMIDLLERCARTGWRPARAVFDCRMIGRFHTTREPMRGLVADMQAAERRPEIASVSLVHGFPWGDVADMGAQVLVLGRSEEHTSELQSLMRISYAVFCLKKKIQINFLPTHEYTH